MQDDLPLSRKGRMISSTNERSRAWSLTASLRFFLSNRFEVAVVNALGEELLKSSVGADFRQSQHDVHLLSNTIVHVKHQTEMEDTHSQQFLLQIVGAH